MFEQYRLLANGSHHNGPNFEFLWHFSQRTKDEEENDETKAARNYSRLNYGDEKCFQQYISFHENKYCRVAQSRTISDSFSILRFRSRDFAIMKISKMSAFYCFLLFIFQAWWLKEKGLSRLQASHILCIPSGG